MKYNKLVCPECGHKLIADRAQYCDYIEDKNGYISGCGCRVPFNKRWHFCPYCGKRICNLGGKERD